MQWSAINCSRNGQSKTVLMKLETKRKKTQALIVPSDYCVLEEQSVFVK